MIALCVVLAGTTAIGCNLSSSRVAHGQRYQSEDARYDPYFDAVHQQQVAAAAWADEKKAARRPLLNALGLTPGADEDTVLSATRARAKKIAGGGGGKLDLASAHVTPVGASDPPLFSAVEEAARLELDRARKLRASADKLEEMAKRGEELKKSADHEYENRGAEKADEKKSDKRNEIRRELGGSVTACRRLGRDANTDAQAAQDFLQDLGEAIEAKDAPRRRRGDRPSNPLPPPPPAKVEPPKEEPRREEPKPAKPKPEVRKPEVRKPKPEKPAPPPDKPEKPSEKPAPPSPEKPSEKPAPLSPEKPSEKPAPPSPEKPSAKPKPPPPDEVFNP